VILADDQVSWRERRGFAFDDDREPRLGPLDRSADLARHPHVDRVEAIGTVQAQAGNAAVGGVVLDAEARERGHRRRRRQLAAKQ
jgi:hypothetical protein